MKKLSIQDDHKKMRGIRISIIFFTGSVSNPLHTYAY